MNTPQIIKQNSVHDTLPDFRNLGVLLRTLLLANLGALLLALARSRTWLEILDQFIQVAALLQPILLASLLLLYAFTRFLSRLAYWQGAFVILGGVALLTMLTVQIGGEIYIPPYENYHFKLARLVLASLFGTALLLTYLRMRTLALSPAIHRARLQALQARIRPHFMFNCINSVLSIVRSDPKRAETALEDMSDLFRMAMANDKELVPLKREIELTQHYLSLEQLRLGDRIHVNWRFADLPDDALCPPLMLQPLLENAVYHGIEPLSSAGTIDIRVARKGSNIRFEVTNPRSQPRPGHSGNKLALENIRERLKLLFDIEAQYTVDPGLDYYRVLIVLPYVKGEFA